jgi:hypothetical protein
MADAPYNPLDKRNLGESVASALLRRHLGQLPPPNSFVGSGIYAIYYIGKFKPYSSLVGSRSPNELSKPIYVGKAVPPGARKGGFGLGSEPGTAMYRRLVEHARSIEECNDLKLSDFQCRYLVSDDIWIPLGESLLIERFGPLWNVLADGFGNHPPGKNRRQQRSKWDTLHPGRKFASELLPNALTRDAILNLVADYFAGKPVPTISPTEAVIEEESDQD